MAKKLIKITVATVCFNAGKLIARTIKSVEEQTYGAVEHFIVDGNSTDDTLEQVHHYMERNSHAEPRHEVQCLSEPDRGIYDAMNKALALCTGRYIVFLNAGDTFHSADTLAEVVAQIEKSGRQPAVVYGDTDIVGPDGRFIRHRRLSPPDDLEWRDFKSGMLVCHQAFFARTDLAREIPYDLKYRFSADYDWTLRVMQEAERRKLSLLNARTIVADYLEEGATTKNHRRSLWERFRIMAKHFGWGTAIAEHAWFVVRAFIKK